jgi:VWFA-related protein
MMRNRYNRLLTLIVTFACGPTSADGQEIKLRVGTKEVAVPFFVTDQRGIAQSCPLIGEVVVRENGRVCPVRGLEVLSAEPVAVGLVLDLSVTAGLVLRDQVQVGLDLVRTLLRNDDGCVTVIATANDLEGPKSRRSILQQGRRSCEQILEEALQWELIWFDQGKAQGIFPFAWAGTRQALEDLRSDQRLRKGVVILGHGIDLDHLGLPGSLKRLALGDITPVFAIYLAPEDRTDPKVREQWKRMGINIAPMAPSLVRRITIGLEGLRELTDSTGGELYIANAETAPAAAREIVDRLRTQCLLTYSPPEGDLGTSWRKIEVTVPQKGWKVRHRPGYYPDKAAAASKSTAQ